ncbi:MAG: hypothetical protein ACRYFE_01525 [Janthinobacterium lividum]
MQNVEFKPLRDLVSGTVDYFKNAVIPAINRAIEEPHDGSLALSAFVLLYHTKDWARGEGLIGEESDILNGCPFARIIGTIANGSKHFLVNDKKWLSQRDVLEFRICSYGDGGYGIGPYGVDNIQAFASRHDDDEPEWHSLETIFLEAKDWWLKRLS